MSALGNAKQIAIVAFYVLIDGKQFHHLAAPRGAVPGVGSHS